MRTSKDARAPNSYRLIGDIHRGMPSLPKSTRATLKTYSYKIGGASTHLEHICILHVWRSILGRGEPLPFLYSIKWLKQWIKTGQNSQVKYCSQMCQFIGWLSWHISIDILGYGYLSQHESAFHGQISMHKVQKLVFNLECLEISV